MATSFDITGRINAVVSSGSLRMLNKLQKELRQTAKALATMGQASTASALGHMALALDRVKDTAGKAAAGAEKMGATAGTTAKQMIKLRGETAAQSAIAKDLAKGWKLNIVESQALTKAVGMLGKKYTYAANAQKEWVPAIQSALTGINKQKAALVASGRAISTHISSTELFDRVNRKLALGADKVKSSFTDYGKAMEKSLGRSAVFRGETTKLAKAFGVQGEAFNKQFAALTKVDNVWREHVTTMHRAGRVTTAQAQKMYDGYQHLGVSAKELQTRIKASNGELINAATYNKAAREELTRHTKAMGAINKAEEKLATTTGKSMGAIQGETEALMKKTKSVDATVAGINKQIAGHKKLEKDIAATSKQEQILARTTGARIGKIQEITKRMRAQGATYEDVTSRLKTLTKRHSTSATAMGRVAVASDKLRKTNKALAGEIDALGRMKLKNLAATNKTAAGIVSLTRKYPMMGSEVAKLSGKIAAGNMSLGTADKLLNQMRGGMGRAAKGVSLFNRAMSSLVAHLKSFAAYAAAATIITGIAATFGYAVSAVVKYDQALHDLQAITQATDRETALMGEKIREVGRTTKFSAIEVAAAMRTLGQAGFTAVEAITAIDSVAALATGTLTGMKTVVDLITTAVRAFDLEASETSRVADIFANAVNRSKLTIDKLRIAFNYIGPIAAKTGLQLEETVAATMLLANAGIRASTIGTGLRRTFQQLIEPTKELRKALTDAGYAAEDINPQMNSMRDIVRRLTEIVPDASAAFRMFSLRSSAAVAALSSAGVSSFDALYSATKRSGSAMEMQKTQLEGLALIYKQAMDKATDLALAFGEMGVAGALRKLGLGLQKTLDLLIVLAASGVTKLVVSIGFWVAALYAVKGIWGLLKIEAMGRAIMGFAVQMSIATTATQRWGVATQFLGKSFLPILIAVGALYALYKLLNSITGKNVTVNEEFIEVSKQRHTEERKRLETIRNLVTLIQDEIASERERSDALKELQKSEGDLNLTIDEHTGLVTNQNKVLEENKERFDDLAGAVESYDNQVEVENLLDSIRLYKESNKAISEQIKMLEEARQAANKYSESQEGIFGGVVKWAKRLIDPIGEYTKRLMFSEKVIKDKEEGYRKLADTAVKAHGNIQESLINMSTMTQEVWESQMLAAGTSYDEIVGMVTDATGKITAEHLRMYLEIQAGEGEYSEEERKNIDEAIKEFKRLTDTKQSALQKDLANVRKVYSEQEKIVSEAYDAEILKLRRQPDLMGSIYEEVVDIVRRKAEKREAILEESYQAEKTIIVQAGLDRIEEQEEIDELNKKYENKKRMRAEKTAELLRELADEYLEIMTDNYNREAEIYNENIDKRVEAINKYYDHEKAEAERQLQAYINIQKDRGNVQAAASKLQIENILATGERIKEIESSRAEALINLTYESNTRRLEAERKYHEEYITAIEFAREKAILQFDEGSDELIKIEEDLNAKLIEADRVSAEARFNILKGWADYLKDKYAEAVDHTREYANKIIELEREIQAIREKTADQLADSSRKTKDLVLKVARAGMDEDQKAFSVYKEARRKRKEADDLLATGTQKNIKRAIELYEEYQKIIADLGAQATKGEIKIPISETGAKRRIEEVGNAIEGAINLSGELAEKAEEDQIDVAEMMKEKWAETAQVLSDEFDMVKGEISDLNYSIGEAIGGIDSLKASIDSLESKEVVITYRIETVGKVPGMSRGGPVPGAGSEDTVSAMLTPGEYVIPKERVKQYGLGLMESIRQGLFRFNDFFKYQMGGIVKSIEPSESVQLPSIDTGKLTSSLIKAAEKLSRAASTLQSEGAKTSSVVGGRYDFKLNIGSATLEGTAPKSVLERFKTDLRRLEMAGGLT